MLKSYSCSVLLRVGAASPAANPCYSAPLPAESIAMPAVVRDSPGMMGEAADTPLLPLRCGDAGWLRGSSVSLTRHKRGGVEPVLTGTTTTGPSWRAAWA